MADFDPNPQHYVDAAIAQARQQVADVVSRIDELIEGYKSMEAALIVLGGDLVQQISNAQWSGQGRETAVIQASLAKDQSDTMAENCGKAATALQEWRKWLTDAAETVYQDPYDSKTEWIKFAFFAVPLLVLPVLIPLLGMLPAFIAARFAAGAELSGALAEATDVSASLGALGDASSIANSLSIGEIDGIVETSTLAGTASETSTLASLPAATSAVT